MAAPAALASDSTSFMFLFLPDALARGDHPLRLRDGRIHRDADGEVVTILLQRRHKVGHLLGSIPLRKMVFLRMPVMGAGFLAAERLSPPELLPSLPNR